MINQPKKLLLKLPSEEENHDVHFKRKRKSPSPGVSPRKKKTIRSSSRGRRTHKIKEAEASTVHVPPLAPPVTEPLVSEAQGEFALVTNKISSFYFNHSFL